LFRLSFVVHKKISTLFAEKKRA